MSLTKVDLKSIKELFQEILRQTLNLEAGQTLDDKLSYLPTKEEFYKSQDKLMKELKTIREEQQTSADILSRHTDQIDKLNKIHPQGTHQSL